MPKHKKRGGIHTSRRSKHLTISFIGDIKHNIIFGETLEESDEQKKSDLVKLTLQYSHKETNYNTTINLKQVIYNKLDDKFFAKEGTVEYLITQNNNEINKKYHQMKNLTIEFSKIITKFKPLRPL
ncbi:39792_t:CDS:1, partial [Gigaspora margarita]